MALKRCLLELGVGMDLEGEDYTKAARRAVDDAIHHGSMLFLRALGISDLGKLHIDITIAVPKPQEVVASEVLSILPVGHTSLKIVRGGLRVANGSRPVNYAVVANAAILVSVNEV